MTNSQHITYGMPVLTEEQRQALIDSCKGKIECLEITLRDNRPKEGMREILQKEMLIARITLAALEAEPVGIQWRNSRAPR